MIQIADLPLYARLFVKRTPVLYRPAKRLTGRGAEDHLCDRATQICIEGYPSSGNSFSFAVLRLANPEARIAHHCHSVANLQLALDLGVPGVALIRKPEDAISSRLARFGGAVRQALLEYIDFYDFVLDRADRLTIVPFEEVTQQTGTFLHRVSQASGLAFEVDDVDDLSRQARDYIKRWSEKRQDTDRMSLPSEERNRFKAMLRKGVQEHDRFHEARHVWQQVVKQASAAAA